MKILSRFPTASTLADGGSSTWLRKGGTTTVARNKDEAAAGGRTMSRGRGSSGGSVAARASGSRSQSASSPSAPPLMTAEEVNLLVHAYLSESGFTHTAFSLLHESPLGSDDAARDTVVQPAHLLRILQKGLLYMSAEALYRGEDVGRPPRLVGYELAETIPLPPMPASLDEEERAIVASVKARGKAKDVETQTDEPLIPPAPAPVAGSPAPSSSTAADPKGKRKAKDQSFPSGSSEDVDMDNAPGVNGAHHPATSPPESEKKQTADREVQTDPVPERPTKPRSGETTSDRPAKLDAGRTANEKGERAPGEPERERKVDKVGTAMGLGQGKKDRPSKPDRSDTASSASKLTLPPGSGVKPNATKRKASHDSVGNAEEGGKRFKSREGSIPSASASASTSAPPLAGAATSTAPPTPSTAPSFLGPIPSMFDASSASGIKIIKTTVRHPPPTHASRDDPKRRSISPSNPRSDPPAKRVLGSASKHSPSSSSAAANSSSTPTGAQAPPRTRGGSISRPKTLQPKTPGGGGEGEASKSKSKSKSPVPPVPPMPSRPGQPANAKRDGGLGQPAKTVGRASGLQLRGHMAHTSLVVWHPKQPNYLATAAGDHTMKVWDVPAAWQPGQAIGGSVTCKHSSTMRKLDVTNVQWNPDGTLLATGADDGVGRIWTPSGDLLQVLSMHQKAVHSLQWTPNGASLVTGSLDNSVCLWDLNMGKVKQQWATHQNSQTSLELDVFDDQTFVTCSNDRIIHLLAYGKPHPVHRFKGHTDDVNTVKFNPSKTLLASGSDDHTVRAWSLAGIAPGVPTLEGDDGEVVDGAAGEAATAGPAKARLARRGGTVELKHGSDVVCLAWSRKNPAWLVSGGSDGAVKMWDIETGATLMDIRRHSDHVSGIEFQPGPESFLATASTDSVMCIWRISDGALVLEYKHGGPIYSIAWHPTLSQIAVAGGPEENAVIDVSSLPAL